MSKFLIVFVFLICVLSISCKNNANITQAQTADSENKSVSLTTPTPVPANTNTAPIAAPTYQAQTDVFNPKASELSYIENPEIGEHYKPFWIKPEEKSDNGFEPFCVQIKVGQKKVEKCGYQDAKGKVLIKPVFNTVFVFSEGLAGVCPRIDQLCGYINEKGRLLIKAEYQFVDVFSEGLAGVGIVDVDYGKWGYINKKGKLIVKLHYTAGEPFKNGVAKVKLVGLNYCINKKDKEVECPE